MGTVKDMNEHVFVGTIADIGVIEGSDECNLVCRIQSSDERLSPISQVRGIATITIKSPLSLIGSSNIVKGGPVVVYIPDFNKLNTEIIDHAQDVSVFCGMTGKILGTKDFNLI